MRPGLSSPEISEAMFEEAPTPDGDFFGAYDKDQMPWSSPSPRSCATHLAADDGDDVPMDGDDSSQDMDDEYEGDEGDPDDSDDDEEEAVCMDGGIDVQDHVIVETFPSQYEDARVAVDRGNGSLYKTYNINQHDDLEDNNHNMYLPFKSKFDWDVA